MGRGLKTVPEPADDPLRLPAVVRTGPPESSVSQSEDHRESRCWQDAKYHMAACLLLFSFSFFFFVLDSEICCFGGTYVDFKCDSENTLRWWC